MPAESILHIPVGLAGTALPVHPGFTHQLLQYPAIDIATIVITHIYNEPTTIEYRVELFYKIIHITTTHRLEMYISNIVVADAVNFFATGQFPFVVAKQVVSIPGAGFDHFVIGLTCFINEG